MKTFLPIPGYEGFLAWRDGVITDTAGRPLKPCDRSDSGYLRVRIGGRKALVHRLVLFAFAGPPPSARHHGGHKNGRKLANFVTNLAWKTPEENERDKRRHGTAPRGTFRTLSPQIIGRVRAAILRGESARSVAARFGIHRKTAAKYRTA